MPALFSPLSLRGLTLRNRIGLSPMCQYSCMGRDGLVGDWHLVHYGARATGGFGLVMTEATAVSPNGRISPWCAGLWSDAHAEAWAPVVRFAQQQGAAFGMQLIHAGRKGSTYAAFPGAPKGTVPPADGGWETVAPSPLAFPGYAEPGELTTEEIAAIVRDFGAAARRADEIGVDVYEIHGAHGYLGHQFYSPLSNQRTDRYGGPFENRIRFLVEVCDAVRRTWPERKPLFVRISATDWTDGGWDIEQSVELAHILGEHGVDLVDTSTGANVLAEIPVGPGYQVPFAAEIQASGMAAAAVGLITEPAQAEEILTRTQAELVTLGRVALREPAWPYRAARELGLDRADVPCPPQYARGLLK